MKKYLFTLLLIVILACVLVLPAMAADLSDLSADAWYYDEVHSMVDAGHITGYPDGTFRGESPMSLAEFVTLMSHLLGRDCGETPAHWAGLQMQYALRDGWLNQAEFSGLDWDAPISRQLSAKVIMQALEMDAPAVSDPLPFDDFGEIAEEYLPFVAAGYAAGLYQGDADGNFYPHGSLIRGGAATLLYRAVHLDDPVLSKYSEKEVIDYFVEVALRSELDAEGNPGGTIPLVKWAEPIYYHVSGDWTAEDLVQLNKMKDRMNRITGFPGLIETESLFEADLTIEFLPQDEMDYYPGYYSPFIEGFARISWDGAKRIYQGGIAYKAEGLDQFTRNSVICEELIQVMGMLNDSEKYEDSIFYQYGSSVQWPSDLDWKIMELLYNPQLRRGMTESECRAVLAQLIQ